MAKIDLYAGPSHEPWSPKSVETGIGGSEEMVVYLMRDLVKLGNEVTVWNRCLNDEGVYDGVVYKNYDDFDLKETDVLIVWRSPQIYLPHKLDKVKGRKYLWLHDTIAQLDVIPYLFAFDKIMVLSQWHYNYYIQLVPPELRNRFMVTRNAVNLEDFVQPVKRDPHTIVYGSLYNRGLVELLSLWPKIKSEVPQAKLRIFYGWKTLEKIMPYEEFSIFKEELLFNMDQEGITHLDRIGHKEVAKEMLGAAVWAYPCIGFNEVSCITAMKAQIGGAIPVVVPRAALDETVKYGLKYARAKTNGELLDNFVGGITKVLTDTKSQEAMRRLMMKNSPALFGFESLAKEWHEVMNNG